MNPERNPTKPPSEEKNRGWTIPPKLLVEWGLRQAHPNLPPSARKEMGEVNPLLALITEESGSESQKPNEDKSR